MNSFVDTSYVEATHRLALGVQPIDAARDQVVLTPVMLTFDDAPLGNVRPTLARHPSNRHVLLYGAHNANQASTVDLRIFDSRERLYDPAGDGRRFVPRRLRFQLQSLAAAELGLPQDRSCRLRVFPGPAYTMNHVATGLRAHVMRSAAAPLPLRPARWVRILATVPALQDDLALSRVVGLAHGDDRGEFLLLIRYDIAAIGIGSQLTVRLRVFAAPEVAPPSPALPSIDALWDLPREDPLSMADTDGVLRGETMPAGYVEATSRNVALPLGRMLRGQPHLVI